MMEMNRNAILRRSNKSREDLWELVTPDNELLAEPKYFQDKIEAVKWAIFYMSSWTDTSLRVQDE